MTAGDTRHEWGTDWIGSVSLSRAKEQRRPRSDPEAGRRGFLQPDALLPPNPVGLYFIPAFPPTAG